jgi:tRNA 2-thiouridine synthesizing protein A
LIELDLSGEVCPFTFVRAKLRLEELPLGAELQILVDHAPAATNVPRALTGEGHEVLAVDQEEHRWRIRVVKRAEHPLLRVQSASQRNEPR